MTKNKIYFFASLMTFCFAKSVSFDVKVNAGVASISNVKTKFTQKSLKSPEWRWHVNANPTLETSELLRDQNAVDSNQHISKDGGNSWIEIDTANYPLSTAQNEYKSYVTSVAKEYSLEGEYERHHYAFSGGDATKSRSRGGFAFGLSAGVHYEVSPCLKLGATAFFTATNLKKDISYNIVPVDQNGNLAKNTLANEREVQVLLGYGDAHGSEIAIGDTQYVDSTGLFIQDKDNNKAKLTSINGGSTEKTPNNTNANAIIFYALNINREGYKALKNAEKSGDNYVLKFTSDNYGSGKGIVLTKTGSSNTGSIENNNVIKTINALINNNNASLAINARNYGVNYSDIKIKTQVVTGMAGDHELKNGNFITQAYITDHTKVRAATAADHAATGIDLTGAAVIADTAKAYYINGSNDVLNDARQAGSISTHATDGDSLVLSEAKYNEIMAAFDEMSADFDEHYVDQTLKVKNIWGGMVTLSWNATDCTMFTIGAGIGVPSVKKIDNLKKKVGFAAMFEISTRMADSFSVGLRYQYNRINLKEKSAVANTISKVNGNFHMFSATATYTF